MLFYRSRVSRKLTYPIGLPLFALYCQKTEETAQLSIISFIRQTKSKFNIQGVYGELETSSKTCTSQFLQKVKFSASGHLHACKWPLLRTDPNWYQTKLITCTSSGYTWILVWSSLCWEKGIKIENLTEKHRRTHFSQNLAFHSWIMMHVDGISHKETIETNWSSLVKSKVHICSVDTCMRASGHLMFLTFWLHGLLAFAFYIIHMTFFYGMDA